MFYKHDHRMLTILLNIQAHLEIDYDYLLVVVGDTGTGKSMWCLHLLEEWYTYILKQVVDKKLSVQMASEYEVWLTNFRELIEYDMNIYDEGATTLDSKSHMTKLSRDLSKLFNVFRARKFFSVIVLPSFFDLNKYFREKRLRGLVWVDKRGHYKFYTKIGIDYLNAYNERALIKSMWVAKPFHQSTFPTYKGVLLKSYLEAKEYTMSGVLEEVIKGVIGEEKKKKESSVEIHKEKVCKLINEKDSKGKKLFTQQQIEKKLNISNDTMRKIKEVLLSEEKIDI